VVKHKHNKFVEFRYLSFTHWYNDYIPSKKPPGDENHHILKNTFVGLCSYMGCIGYDVVESMIQSIWIWLIQHLRIVLNILRIKHEKWKWQHLLSFMLNVCSFNYMVCNLLI
jgi:preprotein translocase subunit Sss1